MRRGDFQVRVRVRDRDGKDVIVKDTYKDQLVYSQFEKRSQAERFLREVNDAFVDENGSPRVFRVEALNRDTGAYELMDVTLEGVAEAAPSGISAAPELNYQVFLRGLQRFSIALPPKKMEQVITALTRQESIARNRLQRAFVPGGSLDAPRAASTFIEQQASIIAKILMRPRLAELTNRDLAATNRLWKGDPDKLERLKAEYEATRDDPEASEETKRYAKTEYTRYAAMYNKTVGADGVNRGEQYFGEATRLLAFLENNQDIIESDFGAGPTASFIRAAVTMAQLGASVATGALNYVGAIMNGIPYLMTQNENTGFGGGFGTKAIPAFWLALNQVGLRKSVTSRLRGGNLNRAEFYDQIANSKALREEYGLTANEARFIALEIREGSMQPSLTNAMIGSTRGRATSGAAQKAIDGWMWTFNATEQATRRALGLAAYRLTYERSKAAGLSDADADAQAREFAVSALDYTVGEYSVMNRPAIWRSGFQSFLYMYKIFPTTTIHLLSRLPRKGQVYMLGSMLFLGGLTALPFAEDIEDLIDTIAQALGFSQGSIRAEIAKVIDSVAPGFSPYALRGFANAGLGWDIGIRISNGNFLPGTSSFLAGSDLVRELTDIAGPAASFLLGPSGVAATIPKAIRAVATDRVTWADVFRESPVTMLRAFGDMYAYTQSGAIVDKRGYVVSPELTATALAGRMLGFYPSIASEQYDIIRASKRIVDYQREVSASFQIAKVKARIQGDRELERKIDEAVQEWNRVNRGTALEITNFQQKFNRRLREAQRPAGERFLRTTPRVARGEVEEISELFSY